MESPVAYAVDYRVAPAPVILGLDASSTTIGFCVLDGQTVRDFGEVQFKHSDIAERCRLARAYIAGLLRVHPDIDAAAMETPVLKRFKKGTNIKALIPQCYVQGALRGLLAELGILVCDVAPAEAKKALEGTGDALKQGMGDTAACYGVRGEHAADALGVALFATQKVEVERV